MTASLHNEFDCANFGGNLNPKQIGRALNACQRDFAPAAEVEKPQQRQQQQQQHQQKTF